MMLNEANIGDFVFALWWQLACDGVGVYPEVFTGILRKKGGEEAGGCWYRSPAT
ncbi:hypothetical protein KCP78_22970 [Salmonella enterica subsp. enterica]|nr:hypothetical protein KCP78_22970 [Salmonella enterica subsp. enterica]